MSSLTVQDIFHHFMPSYIQKYKLSGAQAKVVRCITQCKTGYLGMNTSFCEDCGSIHVHYNSCRNRCCPMCQELPTQKWIDARKEDVLDAPYFHVVFTLPEELNPIMYSNQKHLYTVLYHAASETLNTLSIDSKHLGAKIGYICVLHTWGSTMNYHPHLHCIVLGGGLNDRNQWVDNGEKFFLPIKVLSRMFRGKYMEKLRRLWEDGMLAFHGSASVYKKSLFFQRTSQHLL